jgi:Zn-dependent protease with chaperone function
VLPLYPLYMDPPPEPPPGGYQHGSILLYATTLALEIPTILLRLLTASVVAIVALAIAGHNSASAGTIADLALIPTLWSILALANPVGSGWWHKQYTGGRDPSQREKWAYQHATTQLQARSPIPLPRPRRWFVVDSPQPEAAVCGNALMLSSTLLLDTEQLPAVLAHELGHLASIDARLTAALNRLVIHPPPRPPSTITDEERRPTPLPTIHNPTLQNAMTAASLTHWATRNLTRFLTGGLGLRITAPAWGKVWREHEYHADEYAAKLGQANELADFLETHALIHDHPVPFVWLTEQSHPPTELRIDKLRNHTPPPPRKLAA